MLNLEQKKEIVAEVADVAANAQSAIAAEYRGLTVDQMTSLRKEARNAGVYLRVVKNTLARRAVDGTDFDCLKDALVGPLVLIFSQEDPASGARIVRDFSKQSDKLVVKALVLSGKMLEPSDLKRLADMPTREQAISMLMGVMLAPVTKFVRTLAEPNNKLARTLAAVRDQKAG
ncbi:MAG: 50S ribosomal protein L10 [Gammaproteobacteria bacterium]|nr:50S ribosomal protein L10 [Gammaproteobacteria bacterium]MDH5593984.1 50S ribosomal protein L10 [Gammaproteobacteria bacterium]MDH5613540.1 50S ribosomal protein L10 [Gammaproteobacteria bacterium]